MASDTVTDGCSAGNIHDYLDSQLSDNKNALHVSYHDPH